jgi:hypothetical protein
VYGEGTSGTGGIGGVDQPGAVLPTGGSGGLPYFGYNGNPGSGNPVYGGTYGGGGGGATATGGFGGNGAVRISWNNTTTRVSPTGVYAREFDEINLAAGTAERRTSTGTYMVSGEFDEVTLAPII